ncbi:MAG: lactate utilization protein [Firmicutes bacterium]|nr:lactate utilization protein [Bacillota bacterium]
MNDPIKKWRFEAIGKSIVKTLNEKAYDAHYVDNLEEARKLVLEMIPEGAVIGLGGSVTLNQMGILDDFRSGKYQLIDRYRCEDHVKAYHEAMDSEYFVTSTNAITRTGELVNMDCSGNRVAAMIFGPRRVIVVTGANKVVKDLNEAIARIKTIAPLNAKRNNHDTPCTHTGFCEDCLTQKRMCNYLTVIYHGMKNPGRISVIVVGDEVGL